MREINPAKFWNKVSKSNPDDCWTWNGDKNQNGYGRISGRLDGKDTVYFAHRYSFWLHNGYLTPGLAILHKCDNPPCVNPAHLSEGTWADNTADMMQKGRNRQLAGEEHNLARLTWPQVRQIRELYATGNYSQERLGAMYGCDNTNIYRIVKNLNWPDPNYSPPTFRHGHFNATKINEDMVREIRRQAAAGMRNKDLVKMFDISPALASMIVSRQKWGWVPDDSEHDAA